MKNFAYALVMVVATVLPGACAAPQPDAVDPAALAASRGYNLGESVDEINHYDVSGWNYVSDRALIIPARPGKHFLLLLNRRCVSLRSVEMIGFTTTGTRLQARFDAVIVRDPSRAIDDTCYIDHIYSITPAKK